MHLLESIGSQIDSVRDDSESFMKRGIQDGMFQLHYPNDLVQQRVDLMDHGEFTRFKAIMVELRKRKVLRAALVYILVAWVIMQVGELVFEALQLPDWAVSLLVVLVLLGFPVALVLAWAYELTPEGLRRDIVIQLEPEAPATQPFFKPIEELGEGRPACVAVMPFQDMSSEQDIGYFCQGLAEEIQNALCKVERLSVAARARALQYRNEGMEIVEVARKLGTHALLEGSVRKSGNVVRISVQLVSANSGYDVWSQSFDRELSDIFQLQREVARDIADTLRLTMNHKPEEGDIKCDPKAYDSFLRGMRFFRKRSALNTGYARQMFERAIEIEPEYGRAWAGLSYTYSFEFLNFNASEANRKAAVMASKKAVKHSPELSETYVALGIVHSLSNHFSKADLAFEKAALMEPANFEAYYFNACNAVKNGNYQKAIGLFQEASDADEEDYQSVLLQSQLYDSLGDVENSEMVLRKGLDLARTSLDLRPDDVRAWNVGAMALLQLGEHEIAREWMEKSLKNSPPDSIVEYNAACFYSLSGDLEQSLNYLERCRGNGVLDDAWWRNDAHLDAVRKLPQFKEIEHHFKPSEQSPAHQLDQFEKQV